MFAHNAPTAMFAHNAPTAIFLELFHYKMWLCFRGSFHNSAVSNRCESTILLNKQAQC